MKKNVLRKLASVIGIVVIGILVPVMAVADWSPERPVKQYTPGVAGFDYVTFNSFVGTPNYGDEREFYTVKDAANTSEGGFTDNMQVREGQELLMRTYVHNGADSSLNASGAGIARNTKVKILVPAGNDTALRSISYISASNAQPGTVAASVDLKSTQPFNLEYEQGSATAYTNSVPGGYKLADSIVGDGAPIGETGPDGNVKGCFQYGLLVTIKVKVTASNLKINKEISVPGSGNWQKTMAAKPGDIVKYNINYKNTGNAVMRQVVVTDKLPQYVDIVPGSVKMYLVTQPQGVQLNDTALFREGVMVGDYSPNADGNIQFLAKVKDNIPATVTTVDNVACTGSNETREDVCSTASFTPPKPPTPTPLTPTPPPVTPVTPSQPTTLPQTGVAGGVAGMLGMTGISYSVYALRKSKKAVSIALRNVK
ncbi:DUF11 domain-containing protein [Candidatus Saccharibacteria bacterium]|nr:DUF11 domain-containing protein [Candidatus Saccharibacteria bacterium]